VICKLSKFSGAEIYILKILNPLIKKCSYSVSSTRHFTQKFKEITQKFTKFYEIVSFDAESLYTSINVHRVVNYIVETIFNEPTEYFSEKGQEIFPPKNIFKEFLIGVLLKFSAFSSLNGFYSQKEGLSMGSKLSPAISNIFLHMLETTIIKSFLD
jgi:hypothetical protein